MEGVVCLGTGLLIDWSYLLCQKQDPISHEFPPASARTKRMAICIILTLTVKCVNILCFVKLVLYLFCNKLKKILVSL